jgi:hypothetical protein
MKSDALNTHEGNQGLDHWEAAPYSSPAPALKLDPHLAGAGQGPGPGAAIGHALNQPCKLGR